MMMKSVRSPTTGHRLDWAAVNKRERAFLDVRPSEMQSGTPTERRYRRLINIDNWEAGLSKDAHDDDVLLPESHLCIPRKLRGHQIEAVRFLWGRVVEGPNHGAIIAHAMGLGKTATTAVFVSLFLNHSPPRTRVVVLAPKSTLHSWCQEITTWGFAEASRSGLFLIDETVTDRRAVVQLWEQKGGVLVMGHRMMLRMEGETLDALQTCAVVVCDEGHILRNPQSQLALKMKSFRTPRRVLLTGTPLQNHVAEYWSLIEFVYPGSFDQRAFLDRFEVPIERSLRADAMERERIEARRAAQHLIRLLEPFVHRRNVTLLMAELPPLHEYAIFLNLMQEQRETYRLFCANAPKDLFSFFQGATTICNLGFLAKSNSSSSSGGNNNGGVSNNGSGGNAAPNKRSRAAVDVEENDVDDDGDDEDPVESTVDVAAQAIAANGVKLRVIQAIVEQCMGTKDKVLIFSKSIAMLQTIKRMLVEHMGITKPLYLDGHTATVVRAEMIQSFQSDVANVYPVFLISTKAGGMGITLTAATRVIITDVLWNPMDDQQALFRTYRYSQRKPVTVYRLVCHGTLEQSVYQQKVSKEWLARRIVDNHVARREVLTGMKLRMSTLIDVEATPLDAVEVEETSKCLGEDLSGVLARLERDPSTCDLVHCIKNYQSLWGEDPDSMWEHAAVDAASAMPVALAPRLTVEQINEKLRLNLLSLERRRREGSGHHHHGVNSMAVRAMNLPTSAIVNSARRVAQQAAASLRGNRGRGSGALQFPRGVEGTGGLSAAPGSSGPFPRLSVLPRALRSRPPTAVVSPTTNQQQSEGFVDVDAVEGQSRHGVFARHPPQQEAQQQQQQQQQTEGPSPRGTTLSPSSEYHLGDEDDDDVVAGDGRADCPIEL
eukprot:PhM_4_TR18031/c2_g1_i1/m.37160